MRLADGVECLTTDEAGRAQSGKRPLVSVKSSIALLVTRIVQRTYANILTILRSIRIQTDAEMGKCKREFALEMAHGILDPEGLQHGNCPASPRTRVLSVSGSSNLTRNLPIDYQSNFEGHETNISFKLGSLKTSEQLTSCTILVCRTLPYRRNVRSTMRYEASLHLLMRVPCRRSIVEEPHGLATLTQSSSCIVS